MSEGVMIEIDHKEQQRRDNYRRAEAFLLWKFGKNYDHVRDSLRGSGMDWPSLFVEFCETVEKDLLERTRIIEEQHFKWIENETTNPILITRPAENDLVKQLERKQKAFEDACSSGDVEAMRRLAPKGPTYGEVVRPHTKAEVQSMIDAVNEARKEADGTK